MGDEGASGLRGTGARGLLLLGALALAVNGCTKPNPSQQRDARGVERSVPLPVIGGLTASAVTITIGDSPMLTATFSGGTGVVDGGVGPAHHLAAARREIGAWIS